MNLHWAIFAVLLASLAESKPPHILLILADDFGFNDIGYHGSKILTPTLNMLAYNGIRLENYYVQPMSTPTRSQLMSGLYQIHTGLQHGEISPPQKNGLPLGIPTLAEHMKQAGYATHMVGKWHIGMYKTEYMPTERGFDSFYGFLNGWEDHYTHERCEAEMCGRDFRDDQTPVSTTGGQYSTHLFAQKAVNIINKHPKDKPLFMYVAFQAAHFPMQVPKWYSQQYADISDFNRRTVSGMVDAMDEAVKNITTAFQAQGLWNETVMIFSAVYERHTDIHPLGITCQQGIRKFQDSNGADPGSGGSNAPLRGGKATLWEGGMRAVGFVHSALFNPKILGSINNELVHVSDWYPTLAKLAGSDVTGLNLDGYDQWSTLSQGTPSPRKEILYNIDPVQKPAGVWLNISEFNNRVRAAIRVGDYKLITGDPGSDITYQKPFMERNEDVRESKATKNLWLFNIEQDPNEVYDLSVLKQYMPKVKELLGRLVAYNITAVPCVFPPVDKNADPNLHKGFWGPWVE